MPNNSKSKNILFSLLGNNPEIVWETYVSISEDKKNKIDEVWLISSEKCEKAQELIPSLYGILGRDGVNCHKFAIKGSGEITSKEESENIGEGILRLLLWAKREAAGGNIFLSLAGGRKVMSSYGFIGQFLVYVPGIYYIVTDDETQAAIDDIFPDLRDGITETKVEKLYQYKQNLKLAQIKTFANWHEIFSIYFVALGKKLEFAYYPLYKEGTTSLSSLEGDYTQETYYIPPQGSRITDDLSKIAKSLGDFISNLPIVSFSFFKHDLQKKLDSIADCKDYKNRQNLTKRIREYNNYIGEFSALNEINFEEINIQKLWSKIDDILSFAEDKNLSPSIEWKNYPQQKEKTYILLQKGKNNHSVNELYEKVENTLGDDEKWEYCKYQQMITYYEENYEEKSFFRKQVIQKAKFSLAHFLKEKQNSNSENTSTLKCKVEVENINNFLFPKNNVFFVLVRNLLKNMKDYASANLELSIKINEKCVILETKNKFDLNSEGREKLKMMIDQKTIALPGKSTSTLDGNEEEHDSHSGLGLYAVTIMKSICGDFEDEYPFSITDNNEFKTKVIIRNSKHEKKEQI